MASLNPKSFTPLYQQVADILRSRIIDGTYGPGSKLPSESELIEELGSVTRPTIRSGLAILVQEGLTESRQGKGVFVREVPPVIAVRSSRFSRQARAQGKGALAAEAEALGLEWRSEELSPIEIVTVSPDVAKVIGEEEAVVKRRR
ncbi:GntR family transcriptional regulator, partial [Pseudonocardia sp. EV170527-09]|uniref:GntR family transcriptional regulator n=1 Tax=Pseudonocardia sp. EV170527-09 TaxID=2603411 RepID=UPI0011F164AC